MKPILYTALTTDTAVAIGDSVPLGSIVRKYGSCIGMSGSTITINKPGYYEVAVTGSFEATTAGSVEFEVQADNVPVAGANSTTTAAIDTVYSFGIDSIVRVFCCKPVSIQIVTNGASAPTISNMAVVVQGV